MGIELWTSPSPGTGRDHFSRALLGSFRKHDLDSGLSRVGINFIHGKTRKGHFNVLRVDGVYYDQPRLHSNRAIAKSIVEHDLVIFQSEFSRNFSELMLKVRPKRSCVIHNGTSMNPSGLPFRRSNKIVASARWRINKRPRAIAAAFVLAKHRLDPDMELIFVGDVPQESRIMDSSIRYLGSLGHEKMRDLYEECGLMIHICHIDSCPNSVVEGLRMGMPVLSNNIGGTPEIVGKSGLVINIDSPFDGRPLMSMSQVGDDSVDIELLADGIVQAWESRRFEERMDLTIDNCARKYIQEIRNAMG